MPELPEVQTIVSDLNEKIKGDTITDFWSDWGKAIKNASVEKFKKEIKGRKILEAKRIGKNIFINLSGGKTIYIHLKMTGHLLIKNKELSGKNKAADYFSDRVNQYIHHIFYLGKDKRMEFSDLRKFGKIVLVDTVREADGLAFSSRNALLSETKRKQAPFMYQTMIKAKTYVQTKSPREIEQWLHNQFAENKDFTLEYADIVDADSLLPVDNFNETQQAVLCIAAYLDKIRLIDNLELNKI